MSASSHFKGEYLVVNAVKRLVVAGLALATSGKERGRISREWTVRVATGHRSILAMFNWRMLDQPASVPSKMPALRPMIGERERSA